VILKIILRAFLNAILRIASRDAAGKRPERVRQTLVERPCLECPAITSFNGIPDREILGRKNGQAFWHGCVWMRHVGILTTRLAALARTKAAQINSQNPTQGNSKNHTMTAFDPLPCPPGFPA
jgi:G:T-mismatch repair DNA endonuclease (very short patch repair protein)